MLPSIELFGGYELSTYSLMTSLGILVVLGYSAWIALKTGFDLLERFTYILFAFAGSFLGAVLVFQLTQIKNLVSLLPYLFTDFRYVRDHLLFGIVFYGGLIGIFFGMFLYTKIFGKDTRVWMMQTIPSIPAFHVLGRVGCALAGCCYGVEVHTGGIWNALLEKNCLPIQLYEAAGDAVITIACAIVLLVLYRRQSPQYYRPMGLYFVLYGILRFALEFWRGDEVRGLYAGLSTSQWISLFIIPLGIYCLICPTGKNFLNALFSAKRAG